MIVMKFTIEPEIGLPFLPQSALVVGIGRADRAEEGQPVVTGFSSDADLPVLEVAENLVLAYESDPSRVATAVDSRQRFV